MMSVVKWLVKPVVPRQLRAAASHARGLLLQDKWGAEVWYRQMFFYHAFKALSFNRIDGDYAEFGCHAGTSFGLAYHEARRHRHPAKSWAFDSFRGLPSPEGQQDEHPRFKEGHLTTPLEQFHKICQSKSIPHSAYTVVPGFYNETLEKMSPTDVPTNICLAYIDCDLYSSSRSVLKFLMPRLKHGMIIACDDYYCWSATQIAGERRAMSEFFDDNDQWRLVPYIQFGWHGASFVVESRSLL